MLAILLPYGDMAYRRYDERQGLSEGTLIAAALSGTEVAEIRGLPSTAFVLCPPMLQICAFR